MAVLTLAAVAASCVETEIVLAGVRLKARPPSAAEMADLVAWAGRRPEPPLADDPEGGSLAPKVPDWRAPAYLEAEARWQLHLRAVTVAGAVILAGPDQIECGPDANAWDRATLTRAAELVASVRHAELVAAFDAVTRPGRSAETAEGN